MSSDTMLIIEAMNTRIDELRELIEERCPKRAPRSGTTTPKLGKKKYGEFQHIMLTDQEHSELLKLWGESGLNHGIKVLDEYIEQSGKSYKSHAFMLRVKWPSERIEEYLTQQPKEGRSLWG